MPYRFALRYRGLHPRDKTERRGINENRLCGRGNSTIYVTIGTTNCGKPGRGR
jgi:hypothetical protein